MTTNLPPEAVEAAARAIADERWGPGEWVGVPDGPLLRQARAALSAALPLLPDVGDLLAEMDRLRAVTVKPDRDAIARAWDDGAGYGIAYQAGDSEALSPETRTARIDALAVLPGRTEAQVKAEALREAADLMVRRVGQLAAEWLRARADRIERGES